jgi:hypothetical protein
MLFTGLFVGNGYASAMTAEHAVHQLLFLFIEA